MRRSLVLLISPALLAGCLSSAEFVEGPVPSRSAPVREYSQDGLRFVSLDPVDVGPAATLQGTVTLFVGALYVGSMDAVGGEHTLALVLRSVNKGGVPILTSGSDLLLEVDGTYVTSNPGPGGHTYQIQGTEGGVTETVMVPLDPDMMVQLAKAETVRGRLGPWFSFVLPPSQRATLTEILPELPSGAHYRLSSPTESLIASD